MNSHQCNEIKNAIYAQVLDAEVALTEEHGRNELKRIGTAGSEKLGTELSLSHGPLTRNLEHT